MNHFIVEFNDALSPQQCAHIISKFKSDQRAQAGRTGSGVDLTKKNSTDLTISHLENWQPEINQINNVILQGLIQYARLYPYFLVGAVSTQFRGQDGQIVEVTAQHIKSMSDQDLAVMIQRIYQIDPINVQHYQKQTGGYPYWHSEHFPHPSDDKQPSLRRVLLWLCYLNDVEIGGETEFTFQNVKIKPATGKLLFSPCGFTHTHCGHPPESEEKFILASWISYRPAKQIYG
jgi:hypothetical protein